MGTCDEGFGKHRIVFSFVQRLAWLPQGRPQGKQKCGKNSDFWTQHWLKHRVTRKLLKIDRYMLRGVWQALNCPSIHATYCVIIAGASPGETKMWAAVCKNCEFLHLRWVWQALNCLFIHATFCVITAGASPGQTKIWRPGYVKWRFFAIVVRITGKLL